MTDRAKNGPGLDCGGTPHDARTGKQAIDREQPRKPISYKMYRCGLDTDFVPTLAPFFLARDIALVRDLRASLESTKHAFEERKSDPNPFVEVGLLDWCS